MKHLKKLLAVCALASTLMTSAWADSQAMYVPKTDNLLEATHGAGISVQNVSYDAYNDYYADYTVYATYYPSGFQTRTYLGPYGTSTANIWYPLNYPDNQICFSVYTTDFFPVDVYDGCGTFGSTLLVHGYNYANANVDKSSLKQIAAEMTKAKK